MALEQLLKEERDEIQRIGRQTLRELLPPSSRLSRGPSMTTCTSLPRRTAKIV